MDNLNEISEDNTNIEKDGDISVQYIISSNKFILLSILTFGLYGLWWIYKSWAFFQEKDKLDINPALRALFSIFFLIPLLNKILTYAKQKGYKNGYSSELLFIAFIITNLLAKLPDPFWLIAVIGFIFLIPPFRALNFAKLNATELTTKEQTSFNARQIVLIVIGAIIWFFCILGLLMES